MFSRIALIFPLLLIFSVVSIAQPRSNRPVITRNPEAQDLRPHERGYRTGYEDGFEHGKDDFNRDQPRDFSASNDYQRADNNYDQRMGRLEEYQDGYRAGFELGYNDGYFGRPFSVSLPKNLTTIVVGTGTVATRENQGNRQENVDPRDDRRNYPRGAERNESAGNGQRIPQTNNRTNDREADFSIPSGDQLRIRLTSPLNSKTNREGDQFTARVVSPSAYVNATVVGHVTRISHSGKATGKTEMQLAFDEITMPDGRSATLEAQVEKVYESASVKTVDEEGNVQSGTRTRDTATRGAGGAAIGAVIGAIAGGGKGAAIGAVIGGAAGAGSVYAQGGKDMILEVGTEMMIRTSGRQER